MPQGCLVSRQKISKNRKSKENLSIFDFAIGKDIIIFGKTYEIIGCDEFTGKFLTRAGFIVPQPIE